MLRIPFVLSSSLVLLACQDKKVAGPPPPVEVEVVSVTQRDVPIYGDGSRRSMATSTPISGHRSGDTSSARPIRKGRSSARVVSCSAASGLARQEVYALCSMAVSFRVTQYSHQTASAYSSVPPKTVHGMVPKAVFPQALQERIGAWLRADGK
jgi:acetamidase/formamidase